VKTVTGQFSLQAVRELLAERLPGDNIRIYEAGGGSASFIGADIRKRAEVTVLDIDATQLENNTYADKKILGDVQAFEFPASSFELIVCYNVIEHLDAPDRAFDLFFRALDPGGLLFIGAPNPSSFSGYITKMTPHWFHVWYYKYILGYKSAGQPGSVPFRTVYHPVVSPRVLIAHCKKLGFRVVYFKEYQGDLLRQLTEKRPLLGKLLTATISCANAITLWKRDLGNGDFHLVLEKPRSAGVSPSASMKNVVEYQAR